MNNLLFFLPLFDWEFLVWSGGILTLAYMLPCSGFPQQKMDPTFISSVFGVLTYLRCPDGEEKW